jgi:outer membrane protein assembly factor BamB
MIASMVKTMIVCVMLMVSASSAENWPGFRGPGRQGISGETKVPTAWSATENIAWKVAIDGKGWSSPIVWDDRVFVTTATEEGQSYRLICLDRKTGAILWNNEILRQTAAAGHANNTFATATPVTDGTAVFVLAADGTLSAVSVEGKVLWKYQEFEYFSEHGLGMSPILYNDMLIVALDHTNPGANNKPGLYDPWDKAVILALDKQSGQVRWKGKRGMSRVGYAVPGILKVGDADQLISPTGDVVQGFDLKSGQLIWTAANPGYSTVPSVVIGEGLVFACSGFVDGVLRAVRPDGKGDVTETHIAWETKDDVSRIPSLLYAKPHLYSITETGVLRCLEAATGKEIWRQRIGGKFSASPVWVEGRIYLLSEQGKTFVIEDGLKYKLIGQNELGGKCCASPAVSQGNLFIRSEKALYCIGPKP